MSVVDLELFKAHVMADDFAADDPYLRHLLEAAEEYVEKNICRPIDEVRFFNGGTVPSDLIHAIMLIAGHWYNQREAVGSQQMSEVPYTLQALLKPYRRLIQ